MRDQIHVCNDADALAGYARDWLTRLISQHHMQEETPFVLALAGGSTPKRLYELLAELPVGTINWQRVILLWGDERNVPVEDPQSNFRMVKEALLDQVAVPADNLLYVANPGGSAKDAADAYDKLLRERLHQSKTRGFPKVNCVLLGMGDDVHTASLFPGTEAINEKTRIATANHVPKLDTWRITLTGPMINAAHNVAFIICGEGKKDALATLWHAPNDPNKYPSQLIRPTDGQLWYLLDKAAIGDTPLPETVMVQMI